MIRTARSLTWSMCEHGTMTIELMDSDGEVFATASLPFEAACALSDNLDEGIERYLDGIGDTIGNCVGHA